MSTPLDMELTAETLEQAAQGLRKYRHLIERILGNSPEEIKKTLMAMKDLTPAQIREALEIYKGLHPEEVATVTAQLEEA